MFDILTIQGWLTFPHFYDLKVKDTQEKILKINFEGLRNHIFKISLQRKTSFYRQMQGAKKKGKGSDIWVYNLTKLCSVPQDKGPGYENFKNMETVTVA